MASRWAASKAALSGCPCADAAGGLDAIAHSMTSAVSVRKDRIIRRCLQSGLSAVFSERARVSAGPRRCDAGRRRGDAVQRCMTTTIPRRHLGELETSALGLGCMGISFAYGPPAEESGTEAIRHAIDIGMTFIDTAEIYGPLRNEEVVGAAIRDRRDRVQLATKLGFAFDGDKRLPAVEGECTPAVREAGIVFLPYSPLGRGFLTGTVDANALAQNDFRRTLPRFAGENVDRNAALVETVRAVAAKHGATPAQVALAWVLSRGENMVPIPGTTKASRVDENAGAVALALALDADDLRELDGLAEQVAGDRNSAAGMTMIDR